MAAGGVGWLGVKISGFCGLRSIELETATFNPQLRPAVRIAGIKATSYGDKLTDVLLPTGRKAFITAYCLISCLNLS
ncbi:MULTISPECIES: hypothetical protein [unclassified Microcoleus]|uniref:hypothetical protein n=1 Tax=unclassified Microcoleus TaxID=2642155 RepID=UPI002FD794A1